MTKLKTLLFAIALPTLLITQQSCKPKKILEKPAAPPVAETPMPAPAPRPVAVQAKPVDQPTTSAVAPAPKPDYNFTNIQFEFNSGILKTNSYPALDKAAVAMKMDPSVKFILKGYASIEGTEEHNMMLSVDRANAVRSYLINSGVNGDNIVAKGYGTADPISSNTTETGKALNRRVEIKLQR